MIRLPFSEALHLPLATAAVREALAVHGVVALPTETFYGLAVDPHDDAAVARVFTIKGRDEAKALLVVAGSLAQADRLVVLEPRRRAALATLWPAPVTVVLPTRAPLAAAAGTLALRIPAQALLRTLLARVGPLTATSANRSGAPPCDTADAVAATLGTELDVLLDGGTTPGGATSTLVDWTGDRPVVLRQGTWILPPSWY
jgi:L-threonylcarbamoyladenylate synthase